MSVVQEKLVVALGAVTVGINATASRAEVQALGLVPGAFELLSAQRMEAIRRELEERQGPLPSPSNGGSVGNTANLLARAGVSCGFMGVGGDDAFGRLFASNCEEVSLNFLLGLEKGEVTSYDFYLEGEDNERTIIMTHGAGALLSPEHIDTAVIQTAKLLLVDGVALSLGPKSEAAVLHCVTAAQNAGVPFVLALASISIVDNYRHFFEAYAHQAEFVAGNLEQAAVLVGLASTASLEQVQEKLRDTSVNAVVTLDEGGAFARFDGEEFFVRTTKIAAVDSTGAGDNFLGAFLASYLQGLSVEESLYIGNVVAGRVIQYRGAQLPKGYDVESLMNEARQNAKCLNGE